MHFEADHIYHVYNRGNNKEKIFFSHDNYVYFLEKIKAEWLQYCNILCYCLMPNHFHFMLSPKSGGCAYIPHQGQVSHLQVLSKTIGKTLSSYAQAINIQRGTSGTLFQKKTKAKCLAESSFSLDSNRNYLHHCFWYIHENPVKAGLCKNKSDWIYSSWKEYNEPFENGLCDRELAINILGSVMGELEIDEKILAQIW
ncbi:MAG: hypothetical protein ABIR30_09025 [Chitinophagaceae bacterium]